MTLTQTQSLNVTGARRTGAAPHARITPNLFGASFGLAGLAESWSTAARLFDTPSVVADIAWLAAGATWLVTAVYYVHDVVRGGRSRTELLDPVFAPFVALIAIVPMLAGAALAEHARSAGVTGYVIGLVATVLLGGWLIGQWVISDLTLQQWHPGYFLPTVAGGYLGSETSSQLGYDSLAKVMFGYGTVSWLVLGSILLQRMFTQPRLPVPLLPTMAIQMAPPVVAGMAWFGIDGGRVDTLALCLGGYAALMLLVQLRLYTEYRTVPFGPGWWAFAFSYAAVFVDAIRWLSAEHTNHGTAWTYVLLAIVSAAISVLVARTAVAIARRSFLPAPPAPAAQEA